MVNTLEQYSYGIKPWTDKLKLESVLANIPKQLLTPVDTHINTFAPQYYIRIFSRFRVTDKANPYAQVFVFNPTNVFSITTSKDIYSASGKWTIEFNYEEGSLEEDSWFFKIEPMDYVEIYMRRDIQDEKAQENVKRDKYDFGVYDVSYSTEDGTPTYKWKGKFSEIASEEVKSTADLVKEQQDAADPSKLQLNLGAQQGKYGLESIKTLPPLKVERPLTLQEKVANPDFIMCGFVDSVENQFSIAESGPNNRVRLSGRGVEKILEVHHLFFNLIYGAAEWLQKQIQGFTVIPRVTPTAAVDYILSEFFKGTLDPQQKLKTEVYSKNNVDSTLSLYGTDSQYVLKKVVKTKVKNKKTGRWEDKEQVVDLQDIQIIHNSVPSCRHIYWGNTMDKNPAVSKYGRMYDMSIGYVRSSGNIIEGTIWNILQQFSNTQINELWVDETGNVVCRSALRAWNQPENFKDQIQVLDDRPWITIERDEIHNWTFTRSDASIATVVQAIPVNYILGTTSQVSGYYGQAPFTGKARELLYNQYTADLANTKAELEREKAAVTRNKNVTKQSDLEDKVKDLDAALSVLDADSAEAKNLITAMSSYPLNSDEDVQRFWNIFGMRPYKINDLYSYNTSSVLKTAAISFNYFANNFWSGEVNVRGDSKFKLGRMVKVMGINDKSITPGGIFYCHSVTHNFTWGDGWITTLGLQKGSLVNHYTDMTLPRSDVKAPNYSSETLQSKFKMKIR